jgi:hypothetical protein
MPTVFADAVGQTPGAGPVGHSQAWMPQRLTLPTSNPGRQNASAYSQRGRYLCSATLISLIMSENVKHQAERARRSSRWRSRSGGANAGRLAAKIRNPGPPLI